MWDDRFNYFNKSSLYKCQRTTTINGYIINIFEPNRYKLLLYPIRIIFSTLWTHIDFKDFVESEDNFISDREFLRTKTHTDCGKRKPSLKSFLNYLFKVIQNSHTCIEKGNRTIIDKKKQTKVNYA